MKRIMLAVAALMSGIIIATPALALAAPTDPTPTNTPKGQICTGIAVTGASCDDGSGQAGVNNLASKIVGILSLIVGIIAVIMIIVSGLKYITAGGESSKVSEAKTTLIYALVGLAVAALAQFLVHFALNTATTAASASCPSNSAIAASDPQCK